MEHTTTESHAIPTSHLMPDEVTGGDLLVEVMRAAGLEVAFGVVSIHNLPLVEAIDRELRFVPVRHEAAAVNAADGYARASGGIGVAITSTGTGAGNAAGSMLEALTASSRVLHITGNINVDLIGEGKGAYHEVPRQLDMLRSVSAHAMRIQTARQARAVLTDALRALATAPFGPVSVDWPIDLQYTAKPDDQNMVDDRQPQTPSGSRRDIRRAARIMGEARRPLIWAGGGAIVNFGTTVVYANSYFPDIVDADHAYKATGWLYGNHPYHNYSLVATVGATRPKEVFYGNNRADFSFIPGNVAPGILFRQPDHFENYDDWPFLWGQNEGTIGGNTAYLIFGHAFKDMVTQQ